MVEAASVAVENVVVMLTNEQTTDHLATLKVRYRMFLRTGYESAVFKSQYSMIVF